MTNRSTAIEVTATVDAYFAFLNETEPGRLRMLAEEAWAHDARYTDPHHDGQGRDTLVAMVEAVHGQYPGYTFQRTSGIDSHHQQARYAWDFRSRDGQVVVAGMDFATFDDMGRLQAVVGFQGELPAA